jgi:hypothetical protein
MSRLAPIAPVVGDTAAARVVAGVVVDADLLAGRPA